MFTYTAATEDAILKWYPVPKFSYSKEARERPKRLAALEKAVHRGQAKIVKEDRMKFSALLRVLQRETFTFPVSYLSAVEKFERIWANAATHLVFESTRPSESWREVAGFDHPYRDYGAGPVLVRDIPNAPERNGEEMTQPHYLRDWWRIQLTSALKKD